MTARDNLAALPARFAILRAELASGLSLDNTNTGRRHMNEVTQTTPAAQVAAILHRHGGKITRLTHVGHATDRGVGYWFFVGDIEWDDGGKSEAREIGPNLVCEDGSKESHDRVVRLMAHLNDYLAAAGEWHEPKRKSGGRQASWTPRERAGRRELPQS